MSANMLTANTAIPRVAPNTAARIVAPFIESLPLATEGLGSSDVEAGLLGEKLCSDAELETLLVVEALSEVRWSTCVTFSLGRRLGVERGIPGDNLKGG